MSFSGSVKEELLRHEDSARHCQIAELAAMIAFNGEIVRLPSKDIILRMSSENESIIRKCFTLLGKTFTINGEVSIDEKIVRKNNRFTIDIEDPETTVKVLQAIKVLTADRRPVHSDGLVSSMVIQKNCCRRAFLRGAFLCAGSISDPEKFYHFEIVCTTPVSYTHLVAQAAEGLSVNIHTGMAGIVKEVTDTYIRICGEEV